MYALIEISHVAKEDTATVKLVATSPAYDEIKLMLSNEVAERLAQLSIVDNRWVKVEDDQAHVSDESCNSWDWMVFGTEGTEKTIYLDSYAWDMGLEG